MEKVHTIDIQGERWEIQDLPLTLIVEQLKQQLKDDLELSEWEVINIPINNTPKTNGLEMEYDGFLNVGGTSGTYNLTLLCYDGNSNVNLLSYYSQYIGNITTTIPVKKGWKISLGAQANPNTVRAAFYKKRTY